MRSEKASHPETWMDAGLGWGWLELAGAQSPGPGLPEHKPFKCVHQPNYTQLSQSSDSLSVCAKRFLSGFLYFTRKDWL